MDKSLGPREAYIGRLPMRWFRERISLKNLRNKTIDANKATKTWNFENKN